MLKEWMKEAETVEEAVAMAAEAAGVTAEDLSIEILQEPQKKTLGLFGGQPAIIRATLASEETPASAAVAFLKEVLSGMGVENVNIQVAEENNHCTLTLEGDRLGFIIGRRGETLDALQYLTGLVANRVESGYYRVSIDIGNYREKRAGTLAALARKSASQAAKTGRTVSLEPMNPYERRLIHTAVQEVEGATSWSVGSEPNRHVVIGPSEDNPVKRAPRSRTDRRSNTSGGDRPTRGERRPAVAEDRPAREIRQFIPRSNPMATAEDTPVRTQSEAESNATLYGRIDL